jgi:putative acetyltransferase
MPVVIREQSDSELPAVMAVVQAAFGRPEVVELVRRLQAAGSGISFVAVDAGEVVGHVQLSRCWVDAPHQLLAGHTLSPLSVLPSHQRRGIGGQLVRAALAWAVDARCPVVFLEGDPSYYRRFGFEPAGPHGFLRPSVRIPEPAFQVAVLPQWQPWMVGALVYSDVFWDLDCVGLRPE